VKAEGNRPLRVQVVTYAPTIFRHCQHCEVAFAGVGLGERIHRAEAVDALPDDLAESFQRVSDWVHGLLARHGARVDVSVVDAASIEGFWQSLRHGVRRFPAVIIDGKERYGDADLTALDGLIDTRLGAASPARG
jgi:glutaredoxin